MLMALPLTPALPHDPTFEQSLKLGSTAWEACLIHCTLNESVITDIPDGTTKKCVENKLRITTVKR